MPLSHPQADRAALRSHLAILRAWLAEVVAVAGPHGTGDVSHVAPPAPLDGHRVATWLRHLDADLADLDGDRPGPESPRHGATRGWPPAPQPSPPGFQWGVAYVVEGSRLGGRVLHRRWAASFAPHPLRALADGADGDDDAGGSAWPAFVARLRRAVCAPDAVSGAVAGAVWAFDAVLSLVEPMSTVLLADGA